MKTITLTKRKNQVNGGRIRIQLQNIASYGEVASSAGTATTVDLIGGRSYTVEESIKDIDDLIQTAEYSTVLDSDPGELALDIAAVAKAQRISAFMFKSPTLSAMDKITAHASNLYLGRGDTSNIILDLDDVEPAEIAFVSRALGLEDGDLPSSGLILIYL